MKSLKVFLVAMVLVLSFGVGLQVKAQCAMCSATVETNAKAGKDQTKGLNNGILFLLAAPYLAVAACGYVWFKKYRRKDVDLNMRKERIHLN
ncbi:hypothetical protein MUY27_17970 [Mucilaginibacter sp. RS28]|uniref:Uncharacterized protein n=1 Tax=Mucilaginibacter straminoryzae TaxID=2932774 RepID=A0A9X1X6R0_9SPHI|nr:hypothetical protein [Mucilaginibacter straminoryzae]MCJ8211611.1 hypothetical protein [Mucilaginibacter straminoryzae]